MNLSEKESKIEKIETQIIPDSRGEKTIEVKVTLTSGPSGTFAVPQGKSKGSHEAKYVPAELAADNIAQVILPELKGKSFNFQKELDEILLGLDGTEDKSKLGANAILGISVAFAKARANDLEMPLWNYLRENYCEPPKSSPKILANLINGGMHAGNNLNFQEYMVIPRTQSPKASLKIIQDIYAELKTYFGDGVKMGDEGGFAPDFKNNKEPFQVLAETVNKLNYGDLVDFGLDAAASDAKLSKSELSELYGILKSKYDLAYIEDPYGEDDFASFTEINRDMGNNTLIVGDDLTTTNIERMSKAYEEQSINGMIVKPNQIGSLTETLEAIRRARDYGWDVVVSHRSGETMDDFIADLAWGVGADGIKIGSPSKPERMAKYSRLIDIEMGA